MGMAIQPPTVVMTADDVGWQICTGGESFSDAHFNYFEAWYDIPSKDGGPDQRFIVCRLMVPLDIARQIRDQATHVWTKGGH